MEDIKKNVIVSNIHQTIPNELVIPNSSINSKKLHIS